MVSNQVAFLGSLVSDNRVLVQGHTKSVAIDVACKSIKSDTVAIDSKTTTNSLCGSDLDSEDESKNDDESLQEAYERYTLSG